MQPESDKFETAKAIAGKLMEALNHKGLEITDEECEWMRRVSLALLNPAALPALCDQIFLAYIDDTGCKYLGQEWDDEAEDFLEQVGYILDEESYLHEEGDDA